MDNGRLIVSEARPAMGGDAQVAVAGAMLPSDCIQCLLRNRELELFTDDALSGVDALLFAFPSAFAGERPEDIPEEADALAVWEQGDGLPALQIDEHRPIRVAFAQGEIVHPQHPRCGHDGQRALAPSAPQ